MGRRDYWIVLLLSSMAIGQWISFWLGRDYVFRGYGDFASFYTAGKIIREGNAQNLYDLKMQWQVQQEFASTVTIRRGPLPFVRPPFEALLFFPLTYLRYPIAFIIWSAIKILGVMCVPYLLKPYLPGFSVPLFVKGLLCLSFFPIGLDLLQGQDAVFLLVILSAVFVFVREGKQGRAGLTLGLGLIKFHLIVPMFLIFLLRKQFKLMWGFLATAITLGLISVPIFGLRIVLVYPRYLWELSQRNGVGMVFLTQMPNLRGFLGLIAGKLPYIHLLWVVIPLSLFSIIFTSFLWNRSDDFDVDAAGFSLMLCVSLLISYYAYGYDMAFLLVPILLYCGRDIRSSCQTRTRKGLVFCLCLLLFGPVFWTLQHHNSFRYVVLLLCGIAGCLVKILMDTRNSISSTNRMVAEETAHP